MESVTLKRCCRCGEEKRATSEFYGAAVKRRDGLRPECKQCRSESAKVRRERKGRADYPDYYQRLDLAKQGLRKCATCLQVKGATAEYFSQRICGKLEATCKPCAAERVRKRRQLNPDHKRQVEAEYRARNRSRINAFQREYCEKRKADPEVIRRKRASGNAWWALHHALNPDRFRAYGRKYYRRDLDKSRLYHREKHKRYYPIHRLKLIARASLARAKRLSIEGEYTNMDLREAFARQNGNCLYCEQRISSQVRWHADHFIPLARGGTNHPENIVIACATCNLSKNAKMPWEWMPQKFSPPQ